jgi:hypothetical protein
MSAAAVSSSPLQIPLLSTCSTCRSTTARRGERRNEIGVGALSAPRVPALTTCARICVPAVQVGTAQAGKHPAVHARTEPVRAASAGVISTSTVLMTSDTKARGTVCAAPSVGMLAHAGPAACAAVQNSSAVSAAAGVPRDRAGEDPPGMAPWTPCCCAISASLGTIRVNVIPSG